MHEIHPLAKPLPHFATSTSKGSDRGHPLYSLFTAKHDVSCTIRMFHALPLSMHRIAHPRNWVSRLLHNRDVSSEVLRYLTCPVACNQGDTATFLFGIDNYRFEI